MSWRFPGLAVAMVASFLWGLGPQPGNLTRPVRAETLRVMPAASTSLDARPELAEERPRRAVLLGSSSFRQSFGDIIEENLQARGYEVMRKGFVSAGLARPDFRDIPELAKDLPIDETTDAVVLYLGMNDGQSLWLRDDERKGSKRRPWLHWRHESRWSEVYERRARSFFGSLCERGARSVVVLLPVDVERPRLQRRLVRIRELLARAADQTPCATAFDTSGDLEQLRAGDADNRRYPDGIHMSRLGAQVVWERLSDRVWRTIDWPVDVPCLAPAGEEPSFEDRFLQLVGKARSARGSTGAAGLVERRGQRRGPCREGALQSRLASSPGLAAPLGAGWAAAGGSSLVERWGADGHCIGCSLPRPACSSSRRPPYHDLPALGWLPGGRARSPLAARWFAASAPAAERFATSAFVPAGWQSAEPCRISVP